MRLYNQRVTMFIRNDVAMYVTWYLLGIYMAKIEKGSRRDTI